jgi:hypothetical protein
MRTYRILVNGFNKILSQKARYVSKTMKLSAKIRRSLIYYGSEDRG